MAADYTIDCSGMKHYEPEDVILSKDVLAKSRELADLISHSDEVQMYQRAEQQIQANKRIQELISLIKKKQKEIVAFESFQNPEMVAKIEAEQQALQDELDAIPIVQQFQQTQNDINYLLQLVVSVIKDTLSERINVESGTAEPPQNCG